MAGFRELLAQAKREIREIEPADAEARLAETGSGGATFLDVRELDEYEQGMIPGAVFIPRGHLESQVENKLPEARRPDRHLLRGRHPLRVRGEDAAGARLPGRRVDGRRLRPVEERGPAVDHARRPRRRPAQPVPAPHPAARRSVRKASRSCSSPRCCSSARAASAPPPRCTSRPRASARSVSSTWTSSTRRTCSGRSCTAPIASASARSTPPRRRSPRSTRT